MADSQSCRSTLLGDADVLRQSDRKQDCKYEFDPQRSQQRRLDQGSCVHLLLTTDELAHRKHRHGGRDRKWQVRLFQQQDPDGNDQQTSDCCRMSEGGSP